MWATFGHQNQKDFLDNALRSGKLAHAYLFVGLAQIGKRTIALEFARQLLGIEKPGFNPDLLEIDGSQAKIEDMRRLMADLSYKPYQSKYKVAIIDNFEAVGDEAANSILKTLEEPNASTIIVLIASGTKAILPTVVSRAQVLHFNKLDKNKAEQILPAGFDRELLFEICDGKIGKYQNLIANADQLEELRRNLEFWSDLKTQNISARLLAIKKYAELETPELGKVIADWLDTEHYQAVHSTPQSWKNLDLLCKAVAGLPRNFNKKLVLQNLFLNAS